MNLPHRTVGTFALALFIIIFHAAESAHAQSTSSSAADVEVRLTGSATTLRGTILQYTLLIINHGAATATNVIVTNPIPSGNPEITFLPSASDTACSVVSGSITCNLGNGPSGQARALSIAFFVPTVSSCTPVTIHNVANVRADQEDTNFTNNVSNTISTTLLCPSVTVDPTPLNDPYIPYNTYIPYEHYDSYMEQGSSSRGICRTLERTHGSVSKRRGKKKVRISKGLERLLKECRSYGRIRNLEG